MSDNPFAEPWDDDRTVIQPMPGVQPVPGSQPIPGGGAPSNPRPGRSGTDAPATVPFYPPTDDREGGNEQSRGAAGGAGRRTAGGAAESERSNGTPAGRDPYAFGPARYQIGADWARQDGARQDGARQDRAQQDWARQDQVAANQTGRDQPGPALPTATSLGAVPRVGPSVIFAAASPLLSLLARLRYVLSVPDPGALRDRTVEELRRFEQTLREQNLPIDLIRASHYALCASLDDVVRNTPWGSRGPWADTSLVAAFHGEVRSGERFFDVLAQLSRNQGKFLPVIELMYACMSLGMQGRYRLSPRGPAELDRVREETYVLIMRQRGPAERALSPHWQGISAPYRPLRASLPVWVAALAGLGLLGLLYALMLFRLNDASDRLFEAGLALPPGHMPAITRSAPPQPMPPAPPPPTQELNKLSAFLAPEVSQRLVSVVGTEAVPIVRIQAAGMFRSGSATIEPKFLPLLQRIGEALRSEPGSVDVIGYTDNQPIHTVAFPSNFQLSTARAKAAAAIVGGSIDPAQISAAQSSAAHTSATRISAEGRADADPIASNDTPAGREQNRRIEVTLHRTNGN
jgi:type VI secretion system protein ImpK